MRRWDRMAIAWRGFWAEVRHDYRQMGPQMREDWLALREEWRDGQAEWREARHWDLIIKRKITGKQDPTRKDVRRAVREYKREQKR